jgi:DNA-directed RNA polymerase subunit RPC12/RpoP
MQHALTDDDSLSGLSGSGGPIVHLSCSRCGLTIAPRAQWLAVQHCPRCIARSRTLVILRPAVAKPFPEGAPNVEP